MPDSDSKPGSVLSERQELEPAEVSALREFFLILDRWDQIELENPKSGEHAQLKGKVAR